MSTNAIIMSRIAFRNEWNKLSQDVKNGVAAVQTLEPIEITATRLQTNAQGKSSQVSAQNQEAKSQKTEPAKPEVKKAAPRKVSIANEWNKELKMAFNPRKSEISLGTPSLDMAVGNSANGSGRALRLGVSGDIIDWKRGKDVPILNSNVAVGAEFAGSQEVSSESSTVNTASPDQFHSSVGMYGEIDTKTGALLKSENFGFGLRDKMRMGYYDDHGVKATKFDNLVGPYVEWRPNESAHINFTGGVNSKGKPEGLAEIKADFIPGFGFKTTAQSDGSNTTLQAGLYIKPFDLKPAKRY